MSAMKPNPPGQGTLAGLPGSNRAAARPLPNVPAAPRPASPQAPAQSPPRPVPAPGDRFPNLFLPHQDQTIVSLYDQVKGGPILVYRRAKDSDDGALRRLCAEAPGLVADGAHLFAVSPLDKQANSALADSVAPPFAMLADDEAKAAAAMGLDPGRGDDIAFVLDANQRVVAVFDGASGNGASGNDVSGDVLEPALAALRAMLPVAAATPVAMCAPILIVPRVFDRDFCARLIRQYHDAGNEESGTFRMVKGKPVVAPNHAVKRRRDHHLTTNPLLGEVTGLIERRVLPELRRAFYFNVTRFEEFKIVRYDAEVGGYFRPHRDNTSAQTMHRRFAMTLVLNAEEFEGGALRFPEFGNTEYRPGTGDAVLFSCHLLHEAQDVTAGERFVLLAFMYDDEGAKVKEEMRRRIAAAR